MQVQRLHPRPALPYREPKLNDLLITCVVDTKIHLHRRCIKPEGERSDSHVRPFVSNQIVADVHFIPLVCTFFQT